MFRSLTINWRTQHPALGRWSSQCWMITSDRVVAKICLFDLWSKEGEALIPPCVDFFASGTRFFIIFTNFLGFFFCVIALSHFCWHHHPCGRLDSWISDQDMLELYCDPFPWPFVFVDATRPWKVALNFQLLLSDLLYFPFFSADLMHPCPPSGSCLSQNWNDQKQIHFYDCNILQLKKKNA